MFDEAWYAEQYPDVAAAGEDPVLHYLFAGAAEGRNPGPSFDTRAYLEAHPEVANSGLNPLVHYVLSGAATQARRERRVTPPSVAASASDATTEGESEDYRLIEESGLLDPTWYLESYPDVAQIEADPIQHYLEHGAAEGRDPGPAFQTNAYFEANPDVAEQGFNPLVHYLATGRAEGRLISLARDEAETSAMTPFEREDVQIISASGFFDAAWYSARYPDAAASGLDPALHFLRSGAFEGRDPGPYFRTRAYLESYADVAEQGFNPLVHYALQGAGEGRNAAISSEPIEAGEHEDYELIASSGLFDIAWYLAENPDVAQRGLDPILHYLRYGAAEGRDPGPAFNGSVYLAAYPEVKAENFNPLVHYAFIGRAEGRSAGVGGSATSEAIDSASLMRQDREWVRRLYQRSGMLPRLPP